MDSVVTFLENVVKYAAEVGIRLVELAGIMVLLITAVQGIILYFKHDPQRSAEAGRRHRAFP